MSSTQRLTLLMTDIVDSTRIAEKLGNAAVGRLWETHDRIARDLLREWRGREVDKSDGFMLLFDGVADAVGYAESYHGAICKLDPPLQARAGIHVGDLALRETPAEHVAAGAKAFDADGLAKPIAARVMGIAVGGQTLLTAEARTALDSSHWRVHSHGYWRFKGLEEPIEVFELSEASQRSVVPPVQTAAKAYRVTRLGELWVPLYDVPHSLAAERDAFVGRDASLVELGALVDGGARLVSILGIAGTGKSRLAQRFGWIRLGDYPGGVWFCDLSQARTLDGIALAVAHGLGVQLSDAAPMGQLGNAIAGRGACMVILDNFEQVARHAEATVGGWLDKARVATFVVTTREILGIGGEAVLPLSPLPPNEAQALFLKRSLSARPDLVMLPDDESAVAPLVQLLDCLPLAIELAAARVRIMSPRVLLRRMGERFKLLSSSGGRSDRQATLRAAFDWSWDLLSDSERSALAQLSVFEGGFSIEAAEGTLAFEGDPAAPWAVDVLQSLVGKSFVRHVADQRFNMLGSVQEYASEHLRTEGRFAGSGPRALADAQRRHWRYFASLGVEAALANCGNDIDNFVVACRRAAASRDGTSATAALCLSWESLRIRGPFAGAVTLASVVGDIQDLSARDAAALRWVTGSAELMLGRTASARQQFIEGLDLLRTSQSIDRLLEGQLLRSVGDLNATLGSTVEARGQLQAALDLARTQGDISLQINALNSLAALDGDLEDFETARNLYEGALVLAERHADRRWMAGILGNLGTLHHRSGRLEEAQSHYEKALRIAEDVGDRQWEGNTRSNLGLAYLEQDEVAKARPLLEASLAIARQIGHTRLECVAIGNLAHWHHVEGHGDMAQELIANALATAVELRDARLEREIRSLAATFKSD